MTTTPRPPGDRRFTRLQEPLLTPADAAGLLMVRTSWIYEAVRDGRLACVRVGRHIRFLRGDLERFVAEQHETARLPRTAQRGQ